MLRKIPFLQEAAEIVYTHQERFDGTGYPRGLKGNEIPLGARIFAIADTLDAITSDRPYRPGPRCASRQDRNSRSGPASSSTLKLSRSFSQFRARSGSNSAAEIDSQVRGVTPANKVGDSSQRLTVRRHQCMQHEKGAA